MDGYVDGIGAVFTNVGFAAIAAAAATAAATSAANKAGSTHPTSPTIVRFVSNRSVSFAMSHGHAPSVTYN